MGISMIEQKEIIVSNSYEELDGLFSNIKKIFLVCDNAYRFLSISSYFDTLGDNGIEIVKFSNFEPNPDYLSVKKAVEIYRQQNCDLIVAVGGGSAIDLAKCVKLYATMDDSAEYIEQAIIPNDIKLIAVPTTAGTGSEATRYAVIYYNGEKQSVTDISCIPSVVIFDPTVLKTLPEYQRKSTVMDALCHAVESFWSVNSNDESKKLSSLAIGMILDNLDGYLNNDDVANMNMLRASNIAGKAINITQTTAGHAMCYKLTSLFGIAHGHAAALCVSKLIPYMTSNLDKCIDNRGTDYLKGVFADLAASMRCDDERELSEKFSRIIKTLDLKTPQCTEEEHVILVNSVNLTRLKNNPIELDKEAISQIYHQILD